MEITRGKIPHAKKVLLYGTEGVGKTMLAAKFPGAVFIDTEGSSAEYDVARLPAPSSWNMLLEEADYVISRPDTCRTLVIDSADWAEKLCIAKICDASTVMEANLKGLEQFGYGKGYRYATDEFGTLVNKLTEIVGRGINVVLTAHARLQKFELPDEAGSYDRWTLELIDTPKCSISAMLREWVDMVLFCNFKTQTFAVDREGKRKKAAGSGRRVMYATHHSCWDAKNRFGLPDEMPLAWESIAHIFESGQDAGAKPRETSAKTQEPEMPAEAPEETAPPKSSEKPAETAEAAEPPVPGGGERVTAKEPDPRIPKALRDLMIADSIDEWDIQSFAEAKGFIPAGQDIPVRDYENIREGIIQGLFVAQWPKVRDAIQEMRNSEEIPF